MKSIFKMEHELPLYTFNIQYCLYIIGFILVICIYNPDVQFELRCDLINVHTESVRIEYGPTRMAVFFLKNI